MIYSLIKQIFVEHSLYVQHNDMLWECQENEDLILKIVLLVSQVLVYYAIKMDLGTWRHMEGS